MKVLHLSYYYGNNTSGAPVAATRLHKALLKRGVDSHFICASQREDGDRVYRVPRSAFGAWIFYLITRALWVVSKIIFGRIAMANIIPLWGFSGVAERIKPDIVHVHLISLDMVSFPQLTKLAIPMVVTLHDFTLINAMEPHPQGDSRFAEGFNRGNSSWIERWMWQRKRSFAEKTNPNYTAPSEWAAKVAQQSPIAHKRKIAVISNLPDPAFRFDQTLRIPHNEFTVIFGAFKGRSAAKGWNDLTKAIEYLPEETRRHMKICVFGEDAASYSIMGVRVEFLGAISEPEKLMAAYHRSDVCAFPSRMETQGQVKIEAMLCGLPVLAFDRTACAEGIGRHGWVAGDGDLRMYADGITHYYRLFREGQLETMRKEIARDAAKAFSEERIAADFTALYEDMVGSE